CAAKVTKIESSDPVPSERWLPGTRAAARWFRRRARRSVGPGLTAVSAPPAGGRPDALGRAGADSSNPAWATAQSPTSPSPAVSSSYTLRWSYTHHVAAREATAQVTAGTQTTQASARAGPGAPARPAATVAAASARTPAYLGQ